MKSVIEKAKTFKYNSFHEINDSDVQKSLFYCRTDQYLTLAIQREKYTHIYWACNSPRILANAMQTAISAQKTSAIYIEFVPKEFVEVLASVGFKEHSEYIDYWIKDLKRFDVPDTSTEISIREYRETDLDHVCQISQECETQSRGFTVETADSLQEWIANPESTILVAADGDMIVGYLLLSMYAFNSAKGAVLWIREIAVARQMQRCGIGHQLLTYAINRGISSKAKRSFLACDRENRSAIHLYQSFGYEPDKTSGQINMIWKRYRE